MLSSQQQHMWLRWTPVLVAAVCIAACTQPPAETTTPEPAEVNCEEDCPCECDCPEPTAKEGDGETHTKAPYPWVLIGTVQVAEGDLDVAVAKRKVTGQRYALRECYIPALKRNPELAGEMDVQFTVSGSTGKIIASIVRNSTIEDQDVQKCMTDKIKKWTFPKSEKKTSVVKFTIAIVPISF
ncbi:MAG: AgmX/PglI C-terminal domain-containing protein [Myxococcota bacterium]